MKTKTTTFLRPIALTALIPLGVLASCATNERIAVIPAKAEQPLHSSYRALPIVSETEVEVNDHDFVTTRRVISESPRETVVAVRQMN